MTLRLSVDSSSWNLHFHAVAKSLINVVPVVKGNGYGFGRETLMSHAVSISNEIAVGTVFEASDVPANCTAIVLTPAGTEIPKSLPSTAVLTVGSLHQIKNLEGNSWRGSVVVKLRSSMNRYGANKDELTDILAALKSAELTQVGWSIHPPLDGTEADHLLEIEKWMSEITSDLPWFISHINGVSANELRKKFPKNKIRVRSGTSLWLGDKSMIKLTADVLDIRSVKKGETAGYRNVEINSDSIIAMVGVGSSHGLQLVGEGASPFHFNNTRLDLVEPPHMHTSMVFIPKNSQALKITDSVEVQQPLTRIHPDIVTWF